MIRSNINESVPVYCRKLLVRNVIFIDIIIVFEESKYVKTFIYLFYDVRDENSFEKKKNGKTILHFCT